MRRAPSRSAVRPALAALLAAGAAGCAAGWTAVQVGPDGQALGAGGVARVIRHAGDTVLVKNARVVGDSVVGEDAGPGAGVPPERIAVARAQVFRVEVYQTAREDAKSTGVTLLFVVVMGAAAWRGLRSLGVGR